MVDLEESEKRVSRRAELRRELVEYVALVCSGQCSRVATRPISESWSHKFVLIANDVTFCFNYAALSGR